MKPKISLITLGVADLQRATTFYKALGFPVEGDNQGVTFLKLEGTWLSLFPKEELAKDSLTSMGEIAPTFTLAHNVASKEKVHEVIEHVRTMGATIIKEPQDVFWGEEVRGTSSRPFEVFWSSRQNNQKVYSFCKKAIVPTSKIQMATYGRLHTIHTWT